MDNSTFMLGEISGKLDAFASLLNAHMEQTKERADSFDERIRHLENWRSHSKGERAAVAVAAGAVAAVVIEAASFVLSRLTP